MLRRAMMVLMCLMAFGPRARAADLDAAISPSLPRAEQDFLHNYLSQLTPALQAVIAGIDPAQVHITIVDAATRQIHVNHPEDSAGVVVRYTPAMPRAHTTGCPVVAGELDPCYDGSTGPYRRVYTVGAPAIARSPKAVPYIVVGAVSTACKAGSHVVDNGDGGNSYIGGWSTTPNAAYGNVDAGLQYNWQLTTHSIDNYSPYMNIAKWGYVEQTFFRISCSPTGGVADLEFTPGWQHTMTNNDVQENLTLLVASGTISHPALHMISWLSPLVLPQNIGQLPGGWADLYTDKFGNKIVETPCGGCVFKWMTSIGQKVGHPNYSDGATYGATWYLREISCGINKSCPFNDSVIPVPIDVLRCSEFPLWNGTYEFGARDCRNTIPGQTGIAQSDTVFAFSATGERDAISLTH